MANVLVTWDVNPQRIGTANKAHDHFKVGLALQEAAVALAERQYLFQNVEPGQMSGYVVPCAVDGTELTSPVAFQVIVPADGTVTVMVPANVQGQAV